MILDSIALISWIGVVVFAISGALVASRKEMDIIAFMFFGTVTAIGGGTFRDLVLGVIPVFWVKQPEYLLVSAAASAATFFLAHLKLSRLTFLLWLDAIGMAAFCVMGADAAASYGFVVAVTCGVITAVVGGFVRDMMGAEAPVIMRGEIYASAAFLGAAVFILLREWVARDLAILAGVIAAFTLRGLALHFGWSLPVYRRRGAGERE